MLPAICSEFLYMWLTVEVTFYMVVYVFSAAERDVAGFQLRVQIPLPFASEATCVHENQFAFVLARSHSSLQLPPFRINVSRNLSLDCRVLN